MRTRWFYGWWIVGATLIALMVGSGLTFWSFTVYIPALEEDFGWSRAQVTSAFSVGLVVSGLVSPWVGRVIDRIGARRSVMIGSIGMFLSFMLLSRVQSLWQYWAVYGLQSFVSAWTLFLPFQWTLSQWFDRRRGLALGIATAGFGLGGSFILPVIALMIDAWGWRNAYIASGCIALGIFLPLALFLLRDRPQDLGLWPDGADGPPVRAAGRPPERTWSTTELLRSRPFWLLALAQMTFFGSLVSFGLHSIPFFENAGLSTAEGATLISISALLRTPMRVFAGWALDRATSLVWIACGISLLHAACLMLLIVSTDRMALAVWALLWGVGGAFGPILFPLVAGRTFGTASFAGIQGLLLSVETVSSVLLPPIGGWIYDDTGGYTPAFLLYAGGFLLAAVAWWLFFIKPAPRPLPRGARAEGEAG